VFLFRWGDHDEAVRRARQAFDLWSRRLGETDSQTLEAVHMLGFHLWEVGRYAEGTSLLGRY
jgi:hypothetical protein